MATTVTGKAIPETMEEIRLRAAQELLAIGIEYFDTNVRVPALAALVHPESPQPLSVRAISDVPKVVPLSRENE